jgi:cyclohexa-1,5-dienecarbonyl-CoA hydratase
MAEDLGGRQDVDIYATPQAQSYRFLQFEASQGIVRLTLNRPPANVLSLDLMEEVNRALESLEFQRDVKLVVVAATGKYFSAGFELMDHLGDRAYLMLEGFRRLFENLSKLDKPTLAVVAGPALGAGCTLAAGCDITLAAASAKFAQPEIKGGVFNPVAVAFLPRLMGRKRAFEMIVGGASLSAAEAEKAGLVSRVVPDDKLAAEAAAAIQRFQDSSAPVLQSVRKALVGGLDLPFGEAAAHAEDVYLNQLMGTEDAEEGLRAILEKRRPAWKDR